MWIFNRLMIDSIDSLLRWLTMSLVGIFATPATMALGGVPTGKWKAIEHESAAGNIRNNGCTSISADNWANTGNMTLAMATFDVNSVSTCALRQIKNSTTKNGKALRPLSDWPNMADMPDTLPPRANAKPPPNKKIKLHGILALTYFQVMSAGDSLFGMLSKSIKEDKQSI